MPSSPTQERLIDRRRKFHQYPEPSWCEFLTTSRLVEELEAIGVDELFVGRDAIVSEERMGVPDEEELSRWHEAAAERGAREDVLELTEGGTTGVIAVLECGEGPTVGLRVDIDALRQTESTADTHDPAAGGYRSVNEGIMHACGHDAHMTIGLGTIEAVKQSDFSGTLKVFFQPAEEVLGGGKPIAKSEHVNDIEHIFAVHIGLGHPTGEIVAGADGPLAVRQLAAEFTGESAHAGLEPEAGKSVMQAAATAIQNLHGIPRHSDGLTRVNVGKAEIGSAPNIVADSGRLEFEIRAGGDDLLEYMATRADRILTNAAEMYDCTVETERIAAAPSEDSDESLATVVADAAAETPVVQSTVRRAPFGASEDATYLMRAVKERGGDATFVLVGTDHPDGHHTAQFDIDEESLSIGVEVLSEAINRVG